MNRIYLDWNATAPLRDEARDAINIITRRHRESVKRSF